MAFIKGQGMDTKNSPVLAYLGNLEMLHLVSGIFAGTFWLVVVLFVGYLLIADLRRRDP